MSTFTIGDTVETIDDTIQGVVIQIRNDEVSVETDEGFIMQFSTSELMNISGNDTISVTNYDVAKIKREKEIPAKKKPMAVKPKERNIPKMEVDLHIDQLVPSTRGMTNYDMLHIQLENAKRQLEFAIKKRIQKVVFIHGVGEGVLKQELHYLFGRYDIKYYDADYKKYGLGATEIYIFQNTGHT